MEPRNLFEGLNPGKLDVYFQVTLIGISNKITIDPREFNTLGGAVDAAEHWLLDSSFIGYMVHVIHAWEVLDIDRTHTSDGKSDDHEA